MVCGVDGSRPSARALEFAVSFCGRTGWRLVLVHAIRPVWADIYAPEVAHVKADGGKRLMRRMLSEAGYTHTAKLRLITGDAAPAIASVAAQEQAGLACVGMPRGGRLKLAIAGSTVMRLIDAAHCPVVVVPAAAATTAITSSGKEGLEWALSLGL